MDYFETLQRWYQVQQALAVLKEEERSLREGLFQGTFPNPKEGVNTVELPDGRVLKGTYVIQRTLIRERYLSEWSKLELPSQIGMKLIKQDYSLVVSAYRGLPEALRAKVDTVLEIKPALPKLVLQQPEVS